VAKPRPLAISSGSGAIRSCASTLTRSQRGLAQRVEEIGGSIMKRRGGVMDRCGVQERSFDARHGRRLRQLPQPSNTAHPFRLLPFSPPGDESWSEAAAVA
jgi:hypothetical protein